MRTPLPLLWGCLVCWWRGTHAWRVVDVATGWQVCARCGRQVFGGERKERS